MSEIGELSAGQLIAARYRVVSVIDHGGMGVVYKAIDEQLDRSVAIKVLAAETHADPERLNQFRAEARTLSALNHPHIVTIHEVGSIGDAPFIAMELVEGQTLGARLRVAGPLPLREALDIGVQVARALAAAHEKGVVHRDIKPENLMIRDDGYVKVLDFGVAVLRPPPAPGQTLLSAATGGNATLVVAGTPAYMSPEQVASERVDARSDLFSLGVTLCEALTGTNPYAKSGVLDTLTSIGRAPAPAEPAIVTLPRPLRAILRKLMQKSPADRYRSATDVAAELQQLGQALDVSRGWRSRRGLAAVAAAALIGAVAVGVFAYRAAEQRRWVREEAIPQITSLTAREKAALAFPLVATAQRYLRGDPELARVVTAATRKASVHSTPEGALVEVKDYGSPDEAWLKLGTTPLENAQVPAGYLRWKVSDARIGELLTAPFPADVMSFDLDHAAKAPKGMVPVPGGPLGDYAAFFGPIAYVLPPFYIDRFEVTNRDYQEFVDKGGYSTASYWKQPFVRDGQTLTWNEAMALFRDSTGRPGPATWVGGRYPEGKGDYPVSGVSWFEAEAYAEFAGKSLPVLAQAARVMPNDADRFVVPLSNASEALAPVGRYEGLGPYGTYDFIGNVREWYWNTDGQGEHFLLGRLANSYGPEALPPFDRSALNGFRCVVNEEPLTVDALAPRAQLRRDFSKAKPATDDVFAAYRAIYAYDKTPLDARVEGLPEDSEHWTREKITFNTAYDKERMAAYLFLPKRVRPPFQTVVFFPSARVNELPSSDSLGDLTFMDYVVESGRAVIYPIYQDLYERRPVATDSSPTRARQMVIDWSKDVGRSLDYLATREDVDLSRVGYLGVSQGAAYGVVIASLEDRLKAVVLLDGGFFQYDPIAGTDQADFAPRLKKPVLMVNGRYDWTFPPVSSQNPLFEMFGTAPADKRHVLFDTPHDVRLRREDLTTEVLAWFDAYLGKVN